MSEQIIPVETQQKITEAEAFLATYDNYAIATPEKYTGAAGDLQKIKAKSRELETLRKSLTKPLDDSKKRIMDLFRSPTDFLHKAENIVKQAMVGWQQEQERIRREEQARLDEIQRKETEKAERAAARAREKAAAAETEEARIKAEAKAAEMDAKAELTKSIAPVVESKVEDVIGISTRKIWKYRIVDVNKIPREYMLPNEKMIGEIGRVTKGTTKIDGVQFYAEDSIAARR